VTHSNRVFLIGVFSLFVRVCAMIVYLAVIIYLGIFSIKLLLIGLILNYAGGVILLRYIIEKFIGGKGETRFGFMLW